MTGIFEQTEKNTKAIHKVILTLLKEPNGIRVGFDSSSRFSELVTKLKRGYFRPPVFSKKAWIRNNIVSDQAMYSFLAPHIELQMVYKGKLMSWSGTGLSLNQKSSLPMLEEMVASIRADIYAVVQLGVDRNEFEGLLDDI